MELSKLKENKKIGVRKIQREGLKSIKNTKIVVPLYKKEFPSSIISILEDRAVVYGKDPNQDFIAVRLYELNKLIKSKFPEAELVNWNHVIHFHLPKWIIVKTNGLFEDLTIERVNSLLDSFFSYMPFVLLRMTGNKKFKFGEGFDVELSSKDYTRNVYARHRLKELLKKQIIDKLREIEILEV